MMKTLRELNLEYWGRVHDMCEGTNVKPCECVKYRDKKNVFTRHPILDEETDVNDYELAVAILEDKPVFVGDVVYDKDTGDQSIITRHVDGSFAFNDNSWITIKELSNYYTWHPPKPRRAFELNGVELPCPISVEKDNTKYTLAISHVQGSINFHFESFADLSDVYMEIKNLLTKAMDKQ